MQNSQGPQDELENLHSIVGLRAIRRPGAGEGPRIAQSRADPAPDLPVAGFQYYKSEQLWPRLRVNDPLALIREPENKYDKRAVEIYWKNRKLGYLPRDENIVVSQLMDRRIPLTAKIIDLEKSANPWKRVTVAVEMYAG